MTRSADDKRGNGSRDFQHDLRLLEQAMQRAAVQLKQRLKRLQANSTIQEIEQYKAATLRQYEAFQREKQAWQQSMDEQRQQLRQETQKLEKLRADMQRKNSALKDALQTVEQQRDVLMSLLKTGPQT
jgi:cell division septum initiation protein DivIVA